MIAEDLQKRNTTYKEDKGYAVAYIKLCQGQKYEGFYLTPSGLDGENDRGSTKDHSS